MLSEEMFKKAAPNPMCNYNHQIYKDTLEDNYWWHKRSYSQEKNHFDIWISKDYAFAQAFVSGQIIFFNLEIKNLITT